MDELNFDFIDNAINAIDTATASNIENNAFNTATNAFNEMNQRNEDYFSSNAETDAGKSFDAYQKSLQRNMNNLMADSLMSQSGMSRADAELLAKTPEMVANDAKGAKGAGKFDFRIGDKPEGGWAKATKGERYEALEKTGKNLRELPKESKEYAENVGDILEYLDTGNYSLRKLNSSIEDYDKFTGEDNSDDDNLDPISTIGRLRNNNKKIRDTAMEAANNIVTSGNSDAAKALAGRMSDKQKSELDINKSLRDVLKNVNSLNAEGILNIVADPIMAGFIDKKNIDTINKKLAVPKSEVDAIETLNILNNMGENVSDLAKILKSSVISVIKDNNWRTNLSNVTEDKPTEDKPSTKAADSIAEIYNRKKLSEYYDPKGPIFTDEEVKGMAKTLGKQFIANLREGRVRDTWNDFVKGNARAATKVLNTLDDFWKHPLKNLKTIVTEVKNTNLLSLILGTALSGLDYSTTEETEENENDENLEGSGGATGDVEVVIEDILDKIATGELDEGNVTTYINNLSDDETVSEKDKGLFTVEKNVSKDENKYNKGLKETPSDEEIKAFFKPAVLRLMSSRL